MEYPTFLVSYLLADYSQLKSNPKAGFKVKSKKYLNIILSPFVYFLTDYNTFINFYQQHGLVRAFTWTTPFGDTADTLSEAI